MSGSKALLKAARQRLEAAGVETAILDARHLLAFSLGLRFSEVGLSSSYDLSPEQEEVFQKLVERRAAREPLQRLLGHWEFWSLELQMGEAGLIPRPDSETLIDAVLHHRTEREAPLSILDLGTGTGCLLLALLSEYPKAAGLGIDRSVDAVKLAASNAERLGLAGRARFQTGDWGADLSQRFDLVISNPPYIPCSEIDGLEPEVAGFEPRLALDGGPDGLKAYRAIAAQLPGLLAPGGLAVLEVGAGQSGQVATLLAGQGLANIEIRADLGGIPRAVLAEKRK